MKVVNHPRWVAVCVALLLWHGGHVGQGALAQGLPSLQVSTSALGAVVPTLADTVERLKPSLVIVGSYRVTDQPRFRLLGTGFVVGDGRRVVTNAHVLSVPEAGAEPSQLMVQVWEAPGRWVPRVARVLTQDASVDLAVLAIEGAAVPAMRLVESSGVRDGQDLAFMGFPIGGVLGFAPVTHRATVSSVTQSALPSPSSEQLSERAIRSLRRGPVTLFQLDATAYPGNSGGPLFDPATGEVLGVMNMVLLKGTRESALSQPTGISYAVPSSYVLSLLRQLP